MSTDLVPVVFNTMPAALTVPWFYDKPPEVNHETSLVPRVECQRVVEAYEAMKANLASEVESLRTVRDLLDAFPQKKPDNTATLMRVLKEAFLSIPYTLHGPVFTILTNRHSFIPAKAEIVKAIDEVKEPLLRSCIMARKHLVEHRRRETLPPPPGKKPSDLSQTLATMPKTSELAAVVATTLCRMQGRSELTDADLAERKEAMRRQIAEAPPLPAVQKPLSPEAQARHDLLMQSLAEKRQAISERVGV